MRMSTFISKMIGDKRRWRKYKARTQHLPANYRKAVEGLQRYLMYFGPGDSDGAMSMFEDLADLFEQAAADGTPIGDIVGADPAEFAEAFARNYFGRGGYVTRERERLVRAIEDATRQEKTS
jgi:DNA-binding ferritin-like protein (Dps family)